VRAQADSPHPVRRVLSSIATSRQITSRGNQGDFRKASNYAKVYVMTTVDDIKKAVSGLDPGDLAQFRAWFEAFDEAWFDQKIERDAQAGKLDGLAEQALRDFREGRTREI